MKKNGLPYNKDAGFKIPENYFEAFEDRLMEKIGHETEPVLEVENTGFSVPEHYFDSLEDRVMEKWQGRRRSSKVISLLNKEAFYYAAGVAAVFVAIITSFWFQQPETFSLENTDVLSLEGYIDESIDYSTPEVARMFTEEDFGFAPSSQSGYIDEQALIEYLNENIEEPALIFNED